MAYGPFTRRTGHSTVGTFANATRTRGAGPNGATLLVVTASRLLRIHFYMLIKLSDARYKCYGYEGQTSPTERLYSDVRRPTSAEAALAVTATDAVGVEIALFPHSL